MAERKVKGLLAAGAQVKVIAPEVTPLLDQLARRGQIKLIKRCFRPGDLAGAWLAFAATNHPETQEAVAAEAEKTRIFCNVVDNPENSSFIVPSVIRRGRLQIALSTSGASPAVARRLREQLEELFGPEYEEFLELLARWRQEILSQNLSQKEKRRILELLALAPIPQWLKRGEKTHLKAIARYYNLPED